MANRGHFPPQKHLIYRPVGFEQPRIFNSPHYENAPIVPKAQNCAASPISQVFPSEPRRTYPTQVFQNNSDRGQAHLPKPDEQQEMRHIQIQPNYAVQVNYDHDKSRQPAKIPAKYLTLINSAATVKILIHSKCKFLMHSGHAKDPTT